MSISRLFSRELPPSPISLRVACSLIGLFQRLLEVYPAACKSRAVLASSCTSTVAP